MMAKKKRICYPPVVMVTLKRVEVPPDPPSQITLKCPYCPQRFHLNYSNADRNRVSSLVEAAQNAIREDHKFRSHSDAIDLNWLRT
jgi:hypothetical protein